MNQREQQLLLAFFEQIYEAEQALDHLRSKLVAEGGYNPSLLFQLISKGTQCISPRQLNLFLLDRLPCNERELYQIFEKFDSSRKGVINKQDFLNQLTPFGQATKHYQNGTVTPGIESLLMAYFSQILHRLRVVDVSRKQVVLLSPPAAFTHLDFQRSGLLGIDQLRHFFNINDFHLNDRQLAFLLHGLRRRCYTFINLEVFCQNLCPLEFGQYTKYAEETTKQCQEQQLSRSRGEEEVMRRSREQSQKIQHQIQKAERKRQAQLERQLELEEKIHIQITAQDAHKNAQLRRAMLEEDRTIRHAINYPLPGKPYLTPSYPAYPAYPNSAASSPPAPDALKLVYEKQLEQHRRRQQTEGRIQRQPLKGNHVTPDKNEALRASERQPYSAYTEEKILEGQNEYEKELARTRMEIQERRSQLAESYRIAGGYSRNFHP